MVAAILLLSESRLDVHLLIISGVGDLRPSVRALMITDNLSRAIPVERSHVLAIIQRLNFDFSGKSTDLS